MQAPFRCALSVATTSKGSDGDDVSFFVFVPVVGIFRRDGPKRMYLNKNMSSYWN